MNHNSDARAGVKKDSARLGGGSSQRDSASLREIEADDFTVVWFDGRIVNKQEDLQTYESDDAVFSDFKIDDLKMRFYGEAAIVIGQGVNQGSHKNSGFERQIHLDRYVREAKRRIESSRITSDSGLG